MVRAGKDVAINFQQVDRLATDAKEFTILVQHNGVTKSIPKEDFHDGRYEGGSRCVLDWLHAGEATHSAAANQVAFRSIKTGVLTSRVRIEKHDQKWRLVGEVVNKL